MSEQIQIRQDEFDSKVIQSERPVLVDFFATWCGPCKALAPTVDEVAREVDGTASVFKINIDEDPDLAVKYGIMSIPTLVYFHNGEEVARQNGFQSKDVILSKLESINCN